MLDPSRVTNYFVACGYTDLRRGIDGLASIVRLQYGMELREDSLFLFCGRKTDRIKALYWSGDGYVLLYKRLSNGRFQWPRSEAELQKLDPQSFRWLRFSEQNHKENAITRACGFFDLKEPSVERDKAWQAQHDAFIENEHKQGKEPFDYEKFAKNYLHDIGSCQRLPLDASPYVKAQYERRYYDHLEIMTVVDFANYLDEMDSYS